MADYIRSGVDSHLPDKENNPTVDAPASASVAKNGNRKRVKSPFRDAQFRRAFQAVDELDRMQAGLGTLVIEGNTTYPSTASYTSTEPSTASDPAPSTNPSTAPAPTCLVYTPETLTPKEADADAYFWKRYTATTSRSHKTPAPWREISDEYRLEWFHHAMRLSGPFRPLTLHFSPEVEASIRAAPKSADWLRRRMRHHLRQALGRDPLFWFAFEVSAAPNRLLHIHGEIQASDYELTEARGALRRAGGEGGRPTVPGQHKDS